MDKVRCPRCQTENPPQAQTCLKCGSELLLVPMPPRSHDGHTMGVDQTFGGLIPTGNPKALTAYYLGIFGLIPCFGFPLAVAALVLGIAGVSFARRHPNAKGNVHAWVGVLLGGGVTLAYMLLALLAVAGVLANGRGAAP